MINEFNSQKKKTKMKILKFKKLVILFVCILEISCQFRLMFVRLIAMMPRMAIPRMSMPRLPIPRMPIPRVIIPRINIPKISLPKMSLPKLFNSRGKYVVNGPGLKAKPSLPKISLPKLFSSKGKYVVNRPASGIKANPSAQQPNPLMTINNEMRTMPTRRKFYYKCLNVF